MTGRTAASSDDEAANRSELAVDRAVKHELVAALNAVLKTANVVVVAHNTGLTVRQSQNSAQADDAGWGNGEGRQEPSYQDRS